MPDATPACPTHGDTWMRRRLDDTGWRCIACTVAATTARTVARRAKRRAATDARYQGGEDFARRSDRL